MRIPFATLYFYFYVRNSNTSVIFATHYRMKRRQSLLTAACCSCVEEWPLNTCFRNTTYQMLPLLVRPVNQLSSFVTCMKNMELENQELLTNHQVLVLIRIEWDWIRIETRNQFFGNDIKLSTWKDRLVTAVGGLVESTLDESCSLIEGVLIYFQTSTKLPKKLSA